MVTATTTRRAASVIAPMAVSGVQHLIERAYRESGEQQYLRELLLNAMEAGATRIEFGPEWQAVADSGVYRLMVADNGRGMTRQQLIDFLNTFGGGGKPIGGAHENYGVGAKTSLLPWNQSGVVVMSWTEADPDGAMVWLMRDPDTGEYGAKKFSTELGFQETIVPFGEWEAVRPDWMKTGTVVVCLGNDGTEDTYLGKTGQGDTKEISQYLNKRLWEMPEGVAVYVQELRYREKKNWPKSLQEAKTSPVPQPGSKQIDRRWNRRRIRGAAYFVKDVTTKIVQENQGLSSTGTVMLQDGTAIDWYLWQGQRPGVHAHAHEYGYIAALYRNELYDTQTHPSQYRTFGITQRQVRETLTLVARPQQVQGGQGVYPDTARNALKVMGAGRSGEPLPWSEWGHEFAEKMPDPIRKALAAAGPDEASGSVTDARWRDRLIDRFGSRWKTLRYIITGEMSEMRVEPRIESAGAITTKAPATIETIIIATKIEREPTAPPNRQGADRTLGSLMGQPLVPARKVKGRGGIPEWMWCDGSEIDEGCAAAWVPTTPDHPQGLVLMNRTFPTFLEVKRYWRDQYADHLSEEVERVVESVYGEALVARVAHSQELVYNPLWGQERVERELRSSTSLTMAALGLVAEDQVIASRLSGLMGKRKKPIEDQGGAETV